MSQPSAVHATDQKFQYVRVSATAQHLCIGKSTLWQWRGSGPSSRSGFPKPIKARRKVSLFSLTVIEAYLKAQAKEVIHEGRY